ncbi:organic cation/carnitine transporter 2-like [Lineus longissimus]|uniref:organic cation/carnitine transporter 2-like n=1 Tax=Lineus longissimus TaxID=88925 RepID=UPI00315CA02B
MTVNRVANKDQPDNAVEKDLENDEELGEEVEVDRGADTAEKVIESLGEFGLFQRLLLAACLLTELPAAGAMMLMAFAGAKSPWRCYGGNATGMIGNDTGMITTTVSPANVENVTNNTMNQCTPEGIVCPGREYTLDLSSVVTEWDLVCDQDWIPDAISSIQMAGVVVGAFSVGQLSDLFGRKRVLYIVYFGILSGTLTSAFSVTWHMFAALRFVVGLSLGGIMIVNISLPMEYLGKKYRVLCSGIPTWSVGSVIMALLAWQLKDWRHLSIATAVLGFPILFTYWFCPESIRWLIAHGRIEEAEKIIERIAKFNKREKPNITCLLQDMKDAEEEKLLKKKKRYSYRHLFTTQEIRKHTLMMGYIWIANGLVYYGLAFGVKNLAGDRYLNLFLIGMIECVAQPTAGFLNERIGRRKSSMGFYTLASTGSLIVLILTLAAPDQGIVITVFAMCAWLGISGGWTAVQTMTCELFPTVVRNIGYGFCSTLARLSSIAGPQVVYISKYFKVAPFIVCSSFTLLQVIVLIFLPETKGKPLNEFIRKPSFQHPDNKHAPKHGTDGNNHQQYTKV